MENDDEKLTESQLRHVILGLQNDNMLSAGLPDIVEETDLNISMECDSTVDLDVEELVVPKLVAPSVEPYEGVFNFTASPKFHGLRKWQYSESLGKIYIDMDQALAIQFTFEYTDTPLYIRAYLVYTDNQSASEPVLRCPMHSADVIIDDAWPDHVLRCDQTTTRYECDVISRRRSAITPVEPPQAGSSNITYTYRVKCRNTCTTIKRPLAMVFILENDVGYGYGRQKILLRICSLPKRERDREEKFAEKMRSQTESTNIILEGLEEETYRDLLTSLLDSLVGRSMRVPSDQDGMIIEQLRQQLQSLQFQ